MGKGPHLPLWCGDGIAFYTLPIDDRSIYSPKWQSYKQNLLNGTLWLIKGLYVLDEEMEAFSSLSPGPIRLISCGGFTALRYLRNRISTRGLDYFLHSSTPDPVREGLKAAISRVSERLRYVPAWCNDGASIFVNLLSQPDELFRQSVEQRVVLYSGRNVVIYTVLWIWLLVRKLKRLQMDIVPPRMEDLRDCVGIARVIYLESGMIGKDMLQQFDHSEREPPVFQSTARLVGDMARREWGSFPFQLEGLPLD